MLVKISNCFIKKKKKKLVYQGWKRKKDVKKKVTKFIILYYIILFNKYIFNCSQFNYNMNMFNGNRIKSLLIILFANRSLFLIAKFSKINVSFIHISCV